MTLRISVIFFCLLLEFFQKFGYLLLNTVFSPPCPGGGMADAADLKSASLWEYGFDPRPGYQLSFYEKRKLDKEKRRVAFLKKAWQKLRRYFFTGGVFFLFGEVGAPPLAPDSVGISGEVCSEAAPLAPLYFWGTLPLDFSQKLLQDDKRKIEKFFCNAILFLC